MQVVPAAALSANDTVTAVGTGFANVLFSNGYYGFCLDRDKDGVYPDDAFVPAENTTAATSNVDGSDISQALKVLFTQCFEDIFVSDGSGSYVLNDANLIQAVIWHFTENQYVWGEQKNLVNQIKAYAGEEIPDSGYQLTLDNGDAVTFDFMVIQPEQTSIQDFFAYRVTVGAAHQHDYGTDWESDGTNHWHECACGDKQDVTPHSGGTADCVNPAVCETCGEAYGGTDDEKHTGNTELRNQAPATQDAPGYTGDTYCKDCGDLLETGREIPQLLPRPQGHKHSHDYGSEWKSDETSHWHECRCGSRKDVTPHSGGTADCKNPAVCETCGKTYGETDKDKHTGNTEVQNHTPATESAPGYSGDTHCKDCGALFETGHETPPLLDADNSEESGGLPQKEEETPKPITPAQPISLTVRLAWSDEDNRNGNRSDSVTVALYNGDEAVDKVALGAWNNWTHTWSELNGGGDWHIRETDAPKGYTPSYLTQGDVITITNTETLIQTGQMNWPIPVFGSLGAVMFLFGAAILCRKRARENA